MSLVLFICCMHIYQDSMKRLSLCYITEDKVSLKGAYNLESAPEFDQDAIKTRYKCLFVKCRVMTAQCKLLGTKGREQKPEWMTSGIAGSIMLHAPAGSCYLSVLLREGRVNGPRAPDLVILLAPICFHNTQPLAGLWVVVTDISTTVWKH